MARATQTMWLDGSLAATTGEAVRFIAPGRVDFRLIRSPVPHVPETFSLNGLTSVA